MTMMTMWVDAARDGEVGGAHPGPRLDDALTR
jgi:hypothetical protein